jgi:DNA-binding transcriptional LysR family regulator
VRLVLPAEHPAAVDQVVDLATLAHEPWIAGCPRCRGHLLELCDAGGFTPRIGYETDNFLAVMSMVAAGLGVAMLPTLAIESAGTPAGVVVRPTSNRKHPTIHVVTTPGATHVPAIAATLRVLEELTTTPTGVDASTN